MEGDTESYIHHFTTSLVEKYLCIANGTCLTNQSDSLVLGFGENNVNFLYIRGQTSY